MKFRNRKNGFSLLDVIVIIIISGIVSALTTGLIMFNGNKYTTDPAIKQFIDVYEKLLDNYYEDINKEEMINSAISGMLDYLGEDYSKYLDKTQTQALADKIAGYYNGVGISVNELRVIVVVHEDSPAEKAGILPGDVIIKVNGEDVSTAPYKEIVELIKTFEDAPFTLTVVREEQERTFELKREKLFVPVVEKRLIEENGKKIGYIYLDTFSETASLQLERAIAKLEEQGMESLILDLRGNSGGLLSAAEGVASQFLEKGSVVYSLEEKNNTSIYKDKTETKFDKRIVILANGGSASASEVLIAAIKDNLGATIVGTKTFGKGKVQQASKLDDGTMIKYTTARWLTPTGICIDGIGILPDYEVLIPEAPEDVAVETYVPDDTQLKKAVELLAN